MCKEQMCLWLVQRPRPPRCELKGASSRLCDRNVGSTWSQRACVPGWKGNTVCAVLFVVRDVCAPLCPRLGSLALAAGDRYVHRERAPPS